MQPDSLIPDPSNPQAWNRYSYALNNPIRYNDPSGHVSCEDDENGKCIDYESQSEHKFYKLFSHGLKVSRNLGRKDALEAMSEIVDKASSIYGNDSVGMMNALSMLFIGVSGSGPGTLKKADDAFNHGNPPFALTFGDKGFNSDFRDRQNQVRHVWGYIAEAYSPGLMGLPPGLFSGSVANYWHEYTELGDRGGSWNDFILSFAGIEIAVNINIGAVSLSGLGDYLRETLGENASAHLLSPYRANEFPITHHFLPSVPK